ncbi:MAG: hypothetical protein NTW31_07415 [Bacteroidetes bacterium]|nr:hypothetical protein [Bacteroidota bacterium]
MKNILIAMFVLGVTLSCIVDNGGPSAENGKLSGVASYRDAYKSADYADAGCEIYAINENDFKSTGYGDLKNVIERFQGYKYDYLLSIYNSIDPVRNNKMRDNFDTLSNFTFKYISGFKKLPAIVRAETNGTGNYTLCLRPGKYYLLVISGSVTSNNIAESKGNIGYKIVDVKSAQETIQNVKFQKYEMTGIMVARNLSGC